VPTLCKILGCSSRTRHGATRDVRLYARGRSPAPVSCSRYASHATHAVDRPTVGRPPVANSPARLQLLLYRYPWTSWRTAAPPSCCCTCNGKSVTDDTWDTLHLDAPSSTVTRSLAVTRTCARATHGWTTPVSSGRVNQVVAWPRRGAQRPLLTELNQGSVDRSLADNDSRPRSSTKHNGRSRLKGADDGGTATTGLPSCVPFCPTPPHTILPHSRYMDCRMSGYLRNE
jgi:hypothetical protein